MVHGGDSVTEPVQGEPIDAAPVDTGPAEAGPLEAAPVEPSVRVGGVPEQGGASVAEVVVASEPVTSRTVFRWSIAAGLGLLVVSLAMLIVYSVRDLLVQVAVAAFVALSLDPAVRWLIRRGLRRSWAVGIIFALFVILLGILMWLAVPPLLREATGLASDFPGYLKTLRESSPTLRSVESRFNLQPKLDAFAADFLTRIQGDALGFGQRFLGALFSTLLVVVLTVYFMADLPRLRRAIVRVFPSRQRPQVSHAVNVVIDKVGAYMIANLVISAIAGVTTFVALFALRVPFALPLAFFVALADLIPLVGATIGAVVCTVVAAATGQSWVTPVLVAAFFVLYQQLENYLIAPRVLRHSVDMPSVAVLLAALLGGSVLGLVGALMAIPVAAAIKVIATPMMRARDAVAADSS
jgi:predicted PurR-regulated permease PerM